MKILSYKNEKGSRIYNGDVIGIKDNICFVMDGSTALFDDYKFFKDGDLFNYMQLLRDSFNNGDIILELQNAIRESNKKLVGIEKYHEYELPTYTIAVIKEDEEKLEYYILCDTLISILYKDGRIEHIVDKRIDRIKDECRNRNNEIRSMDVSDTEKKELLLENERSTRMKINTDDGFPVGSTNPNSILKGITGMIDKKEIDRILICSDGYYDTYREIPNDKKCFDKQYVEDRASKILEKEVRDDMSYILIEL